MRRRILDLRQHRARHPQQFQEVVVPLPGVDIEQQRARGVGGVGGVDLAAGQPPQQVAIDGAEQQLATFGAGARIGHVIEQPRDFGAGKIRIDDQAGFGRDIRLVAVGLELRAGVGGAAVLPDDGAVDGLSRGAVPHHGGLALVGDADGGDIPGGDARPLQRVAAGGDGGDPDVLGFVLDPARGREVLRKFQLRRGGDGNVLAKHDGARRGGALVDGQHEGGHGGASRVVLVVRQGKRIGGRRSIWLRRRAIASETCRHRSSFLSLPLAGRVAGRRPVGWGYNEQ